MIETEVDLPTFMLFVIISITEICVIACTRTKTHELATSALLVTNASKPVLASQCFFNVALMMRSALQKG